jgi:hypothetical protein
MLPNVGTSVVTVFGEAVLAKFAKKHPSARKPPSRFLAIVASGVWPHFPALKQTFSSADYVQTTGVTIFDMAATNIG